MTIGFYQHINGLVQERCSSIANALELNLSCTNPLKCSYVFEKNELPYGKYISWSSSIAHWTESAMIFVPLDLIDIKLYIGLSSGLFIMLYDEFGARSRYLRQG